MSSYRLTTAIKDFLIYVVLTIFALTCASATR
jgi:hypothetical protein